MTWSPLLEQVREPKNPQALRDVRMLLARLVEAFGVNEVARLLSVDAAMVSRWRKGAGISAQMSRRIIELHDILNRALQLFRPRQAMLWLVGSEPLLGGARPIDVLAVRGAAPLIEALAGIEGGAYA